MCMIYTIQPFLLMCFPYVYFVKRIPFKSIACVKHFSSKQKQCYDLNADIWNSLFFYVNKQYNRMQNIVQVLH